MTLIKSISGIRGTIGGKQGDNLTPIDIVKYASAFGSWAKSQNPSAKIVIGRDARVSGKMVSELIANTLTGLGIDVVDLGLSTTPTVEIAVPKEGAVGGIIVTASHNPGQWNALKLLNEYGEFLDQHAGQKVIDIANSESIEFEDVSKLGSITEANQYINQHVTDILDLNLVDSEAIKQKGFRVAIDCVNSTGGLALPKLLKALGASYVEELYCDPTGIFPHNPEPLPENITHICEVMKKGSFDVGFIVDPDVDRLAIVDENGIFIGEEYSLVLIADYVLSKTPGPVVSNMSSSSALNVIAEKHGHKRTEAAVGEVNVVNEMKKVGAIIGGEGNGGIIYPDLHYGRDALVGIGLFLSYLAMSGNTVSQLMAAAPKTFIAKNKIELSPEVDTSNIIENLTKEFSEYPINTMDGLKIYFEDGWAQIRRSNTEPIIRVYTEGQTKDRAAEIFELISQKTNLS